MISQPTDLPRGDLRSVRVILPMRRPAPPATVEAVLLSAARVIARNGLHREDYVRDPFNRTSDVPLYVRPMSVVGAIRYAATGNPQRTSQLADLTVNVLALSLAGGPVRRDLLSLESHVEDWADGVDKATAVTLLEWVATAPERAA